MRESIYWVNDIENIMRNCFTCLGFQQTQAKDKIIPHKTPYQSWDVLGADLFSINNSNVMVFA